MSGARLALVGNAALARSISVALLCAGLGIALRRPDVVALGAGLVVASVVAAVRSRPIVVAATLAVNSEDLEEGSSVVASVRIDSDADLDAVTIRLTPGTFLPEAGSSTRVVTVRAGEGRAVPIRLRAGRWGRQRVGPADVTVRGEGLGLAAEPIVLDAVPLRVLPAVGAFSATGEVARPQTLAGEHRSSTLGAGAEIVGIRPYSSGDRLRRINWRATLARGELHVTTTRTEESATVLLVLDSAAEAGRPGGSVLDTTVRAASAIAAHYLDRGDSVGLLDRGELLRRLAPAPGRRQLERVRSFLLDVRARREGLGSDDEEWLDWAVPPGALVIVLSPLLGRQGFGLLASLRARGHLVAGLDTLPEGVGPTVHDATEHVAALLSSFERAAMLERLGELGVPVSAWSGPGSLDGVLAALTHLARAPRMRLR